VGGLGFYWLDIAPPMVYPVGGITDFIAYPFPFALPSLFLS
jgi:hypothetical protein